MPKRSARSSFFVVVLALIVGGALLSTMTEKLYPQQKSSNSQVLAAADQLISFWNFNETSGTNVIDLQGVSNGVLNGPTRVTGSNCYSGGCVLFDGINDMITFQHNNIYNLALDETLTIGMRLKLTDITATRRVIRKGIFNGSGNELGWAFTFTKYGGVTGVFPSFVVSDGVNRISVEVSRQTPMFANRWYYLVGVYDNQSKTISIYLDGKSTGQVRGTNLGSINTNEPIIAGHTSIGAFYKGYMDDVYIYRGKLPPDQVAPSPGPFSSPSPTLSPSPSSKASSSPSIRPTSIPSASLRSTPFATSTPAPIMCIGASCASNDGVVTVGKQITCSVTPVSASSPLQYEGRCELKRNGAVLESFNLTPVILGSSTFQPFTLTRGNTQVSCIFRVCIASTQNCSAWGQ